MIKIKGSGQRMKGNARFKDGGFEQVPHSIHNYLKFRLITGNDLNVYIFLYQYDNVNYGYAFPNTKQIALETGLSDKTVKACTKNLENVGLIRKGKSSYQPNKNVYYVDLPLQVEELLRQVPDAIEKYQEREVKFKREAKEEKERLTVYLVEKEERDTSEVSSRTVPPLIKTEEEPKYMVTKGS
ncbi:helix-turn-helix domain-containing protein [Peribacillus frigoritolerans]|uniref:helix-turn-helix domain-containing protein n=1 Tax=Peribacillus frigoritolerans TaxID=450367 RepID=UPI00228251F2|nr:helix-turn-helix domain-containing protein [Peribacillus frigoritolerans]MCY9007129.1 helix-turn-helix domain-containing protein [Peribacillus frigoritolerans]